MKRGFALLSIVALSIAGFLSIRGAMPFMAIYGVSMQPTYRAGDLIWIQGTSPNDVKVGDVIVFTIPAAIRQAYNYPTIVAHRVIRVNTDRGITFRTKGDNSGEDPFTVRPQDLMGKVSKQISYLGFPLLFFQSQQGLVFAAIALTLLALYLYAEELNQGRKKVHKVIFAPVIGENERLNRSFEQRFQSTEKSTQLTQQAINNLASATEKSSVHTQQALTDFAAAMAEYAKHLQSHTSAIQGLAEASHELKRSAAQQNEALARLLENAEKPRYNRTEEASEPPRASTPPPPPQPPSRPAPEVDNGQFPPGCYRSRKSSQR
ncbi:MAG: signal peptidase I [Chloroflexi bacterium]|nr:signal peptidase I [Chloroflexota bacterium]